MTAQKFTYIVTTRFKDKRPPYVVYYTRREDVLNIFRLIRELAPPHLMDTKVTVTIEPRIFRRAGSPASRLAFQYWDENFSHKARYDYWLEFGQYPDEL